MQSARIKSQVVQHEARQLSKDEADQCPDNDLKGEHPNSVPNGRIRLHHEVESENRQKHRHRVVRAGLGFESRTDFR